MLLSRHDLERLRAYTSQIVDHHLITDLVPTLARLVFQRRVAGDIRALPATIMLALGLQLKTVDQLTAELSLPVNQVLSMFLKTVMRVAQEVGEVRKKHAAAELPAVEPSAIGAMQPLPVTMEQDLDEAGADVAASEQRRRDQLLHALKLDNYSITLQDSDLSRLQGATPSSISVKMAKQKLDRELKKNKEREAGGGGAGGGKKGDQHRSGSKRQDAPSGGKVRPKKFRSEQ